MTWPESDNKNIRGPADSIYVSLTEPWERSQFITSYLQSRGYGVTEENRLKVTADLKGCPLVAPILRNALESWLDRLYKRN